MPSSASTTGRLPANMQNDAFAKVNNLTTPSGGAVVQASYPMNERETDWIYTCPHHIQAIADGVKAGRRLLFSTLGRQAATNALAKLAQCNSSGTETSTPPQSTSDLMHRRVSEYEFGQYTTIVIDTGMHVDGKHNPAKPDELRIKHGHVTKAANALYHRGENSVAYKMHVFFLGSIIAHQAMHGLVSVTPEVASFTPPRVREDYLKDIRMRPETDVNEYLWHGEYGWFLESTLFGEWLCRVEKCRQEDDWKFWGEISGFVVQCEGSGGKKGHVVIDNDAIVAAVDGREDWESISPLRKHSIKGWKAGLPDMMVEREYAQLGASVRAYGDGVRSCGTVRTFNGKTLIPL